MAASDAAPFKLPGGVYTAIVTPLTEDAKAVDFEALDALVEAQISGGVTGVVPCGTTGESPTLSKEEKKQVIKAVLDKVAGRCLVVAGTGSNNTAETLDMTAWAKETGVDACLLVNPYYNKPSQSGIIAHATAVADLGLPVLLYNIPGRSGVKMTPQTIATLAEHPSIVGVKEACGSVAQVSDVAEAVHASRPDFAILSGDDLLTLPMQTVGAIGVVSVLSNILPAPLVAMVKAANEGDFATAKDLHFKLAPLFKACFLDSNPVPAKAVMKAAGQIPFDAVRMPLVPMQSATSASVMQAFKMHGKALGLTIA